MKNDELIVLLELHGKASDIFIIESNWEEDRGGHQEEKSTIIAVCLRPDGRYQVGNYVDHFRPLQGHQGGWGRWTDITAEQFTELTTGKMPIDTPERAEQNAAAVKAARSAQTEQLERLKQTQARTPICPRHKMRATRRTNSKTQRQFWGCPKWPDCDWTR